LPESWAVRSRKQEIRQVDAFQSSLFTVTITLNGERFELDSPMSVDALLTRLDIDPRRVAVEHNLNIIKRHTFQDTLIGDGDTVEIVNFVGGG
jgi:thiamine biosynthesis protein ThiS